MEIIYVGKCCEKRSARSRDATCMLAEQHQKAMCTSTRRYQKVLQGTSLVLPERIGKVPESSRKVPVVSEAAMLVQCSHPTVSEGGVHEQCQKAQPICQTRQNNKRALPPLSVGCLLLLELPIYNYLSKVHLYPALLC